MNLCCTCPSAKVTVRHTVHRNIYYLNGIQKKKKNRNTHENTKSNTFTIALIFRVMRPECCDITRSMQWHDDVIKWKHFPRYWPFVRGIHRSPVNSQHKGQSHGALMFSLICAWINAWVNNGEAGDLIRYRASYAVFVMVCIDYPPSTMVLTLTKDNCLWWPCPWTTPEQRCKRSHQHIEAETKLPPFRRHF